MDVQLVPPALQERLGPDGTLGFVSAVHASRREWKEEVMMACADRFERRLVEETTSLKLQMSATESRLLRWSFAFWIGQVVAMTAIMSAMLRAG